jgi:hypothetical protein
MRERYWQTEPGVLCPAIRILQFVNRMEIGRLTHVNRSCCMAG